MKVAWLDKQDKELFSPVQCKDFLCDAVYSEVNKKDVQIWGFSGSPGKLPLDREFVSMSMRYPNSEYNGLNVQALLNMYEKSLKYKPLTRVEKTTEDKVWIAEFSKDWLAQPLSISCVLHLCRIGSAYNPKEEVVDFLDAVASGKRPVVVPKDAGYTKSALEMLKSIITKGKFPTNGKDFKKIDVHEMHHNSGIVAISTGHATG